MLRILTVCTGNICRSPLAEHLLRARLSDLDVVVSSAGTRAPAAQRMTPEALALAVRLGVPAGDADTHRSRFLTEADLATPDLILAMSREHRRDIVELAPSRMRSTFTIREFARLASDLPADELSAVVAEGGSAAPRLRAILAALAQRRGLSLPPSDPSDDDVVDPYRRSPAVYERSAAELLPAVETVAALVRAAAVD